MLALFFIFFGLLLMLGMYRAFLVGYLIVLTLLIIGFGFATGSLLTLIFEPELPTTWVLSPAWTTALIDNGTFAQIFFLTPVYAIGDCLKWIFSITVFQGHPILWIFMAISVWGIFTAWHAVLTGWQDGRR